MMGFTRRSKRWCLPWGQGLMAAALVPQTSRLTLSILALMRPAQMKSLISLSRKGRPTSNAVAMLSSVTLL